MVFREEFFVMTLLVILSALNQLGSLLSCYSNKPNKLWILSGACGHVVGFILVSKTIAFAELLQLAAQGRFVELLYSMVVVLLGFFLYYNKRVAERKKGQTRKKSNLPALLFLL